MILVVMMKILKVNYLVNKNVMLFEKVGNVHILGFQRNGNKTGWRKCNCIFIIKVIKGVMKIKRYFQSKKMSYSKRINNDYCFQISKQKKIS